MASIANALKTAPGKPDIHPAIVHTVAVGKAESSTIRATIARIEIETGYRGKKKLGSDPSRKSDRRVFCGEMQRFRNPSGSAAQGSAVFERCLVGGYGFGVYSIAYTQDFVYNKVVSNFEAGEIREPVGGHLADYADCPKQRLCKTFLHPDVQARGCTRIEVSLYAFPLGKLSNQKASTCIEKVLEQVSVEDEESGLFVV